jgi:EpsD family peptidyl-prolyl cis-trans isomerase
LSLRRPLTVAAVVVVPAIILSACNKDPSKKAATQVAAKVNGDEITVHQVNAVLARAPNIPPEAAPRAKRDVLARLVDQQIAVEQAVAKKLDRSPQVVQQIEMARAEILARAYAESVMRAVPKPSEEDVKKYYAEHPELFANRRVYNIEEITAISKEDIGPGLREQIAKGRSMADIGRWLISRGVQVVPNRGVRAAEQIPMEILGRLQAMKDGTTESFKTANGYNVVRVVASRTAPVDEATASPRIQQFLFNRRATEAVAADMKTLKASAKIEYLGEFAEDLGAAQAKAKAEAEAKAKAVADAKAQAKAEAAERAEAATKARQAAEARARENAEARAKGDSKAAPLQQDTIQKGLSGLR